MRKFIVIISLVMVVLMGACNSAPTDYYTKEQVDNLFTKRLQAYDLELQRDFEDLQYQIDNMLEKQYYEEHEIDALIGNVIDAILVLENDVYANAELIDELEQVLISIEIIEGLNGQKVYYIPNQSALITLANGKNKLNKNKAPSYITDENDEYISYDEVVDKLVLKYYGESADATSDLGFQAKINVDTDLSKEEFVARTILLIEELSKYEFYIIGSSQLYLQTNTFGATSYITVPVQTLRSSFITMDYEVFINGWYEVEYHNLLFDAVQVQTLYDGYVADKTFDGYVLDYN